LRSEETMTPDSNSPLHTPLNGNAEIEAALDDIFERAQKSVRIFDQALGRGYNTIKRYESLRRFLLQNRRNRLQIVVHDTRDLDRNCPRLLNLLRQHAHAVSIHETHQAAKSVYDPFAIVDDRHHVHRFHHEQARGLKVVDDPIATHSFIERFGEIWEASFPSVSATTLGL
jgi:hypothetical protein